MISIQPANAEIINKQTHKTQGKLMGSIWHYPDIQDFVTSCCRFLNVGSFTQDKFVIAVVLTDKMN